MPVKGKEAERTFSSLVKEIKIQSCSIEINTERSLGLAGCELWPSVPAYSSALE